MSLTIKGRVARTDKTGRFLLELPADSGGRRQLEIEGATASKPGRTYGFFEAGLSVVAGRTTALPYTIWMPKIDTRHTVRIASPTAGDTVITTPKIPGLELHLPRGSVVKDRNGKIVREINITPIPVDRPPFPLPKNSDVPIYFTIQPGGAYVYGTGYRPQKARLIYPNYHKLGNDVLTSFWHYDPAELDWYVYGAGKAKGAQVIPDPGVGLYEFTGAMILSGWSPAPLGPTPSWWPTGDPVDASTGLFVMEKVDLSVADILPLTLRRTYRPADNAIRPFGTGATHDYALFLWSAQQYTEADLVLPDSTRIHYVRTSSGTGYTDAVFEHTTTFTPYYKSKIVWNGNGWNLTLVDGTVLVFGENAPLQSIRDRHGNTITIERASGQSGNITRVVSPNGRWMSFAYDGMGRITQAGDNIGRTVGYQYDANGRLWKVTDPAGGITEYTYDTSHRMLTIKDPRGVVYLTNQYDTNNRVTQQTQADSTTYQFAYTVSSGKVTQSDVTGPNGTVTRTAYDSSGYPTSVTEAVGLTEERTTSYTRDSTTHRVTSVTDPLNRVTSYAYDSDGNVSGVTRLHGTTDAVTTTFAYGGPFAQLSSVTDPLSHTTTYSYDTQGRLVTITDPLSHDTTFTYNAAGQPLTVANELNETLFSYERGDLVGITGPLGHSVQQFTDGAGRVTQTVDPQGRRTAYEYNLLGQVTKATDALGGQTTFTYDANGNVLTLTDARSKTTTWTYDNMDRVATRTDPLSRAESFTYGTNGAIATSTDRKSQVTAYGYDALDRPIFVGFGRTGSPATYASTIETAYDDGDRPTEIVDSVAGTIEHTFDLLDRLTQEVTPEGTVSYTYDAADRRASMQVAGQTTVSYSYDSADRLTGITKGSASVGIGYDVVNRRTSLTLPNGIVVEYVYDAGSQLTGLTYKLGSSTLGNLAYTYSPSGQRIAIDGTYARTALPGALSSATYDDANQIATWGGTAFSYDANGSLTSDGTNTYTWNTRNQLSSIGGGATASFAYDAAGRRRAKTVSGTTQFLYDGNNPVQELASGTPTANLLTGLGIDEFVSRTDGTGARTYLADAQGSSVALTDGSGVVQAEYTYEPFGATTTSGSAGTNTINFTGRERDGTGLHYYRARYYDPKVQRFISEDPLGFAAGDANLHAYVRNAPLDLVDPSGEIPFALLLPLAGCLGGSGGAMMAPIYGRKFTPALLLEGCVSGIPFGMPLAEPLVLALRPILAPLVAPFLPRASGPAGAPSGTPAATRFGPGTVGAAQPVLPRNATALKNVADAFRRLEKFHGIDPNLASERLHAIKAAAGLGPADNVIFDLTGGVYHPISRVLIGSLTEGGARAWR